MTSDLPYWANPEEWRPATDAEEDEIEIAAGCGGQCFVNKLDGTRVLCDGVGLILYNSATDK